MTGELDLKKDTETFLGATTTSNEALEKFHYHPSIKQIRETFNNYEKFVFEEAKEDQVREEILFLDGSTTTPAGDIPIDVLKLTLDVHLSAILKVVNLSRRNDCFPNDLKSAEVSPIFKKDNGLQKENYRLVSVLPHALKVFDRIMYIKINDFIENKLSALVFRKNRSIRHCLVSMIENWKNTVKR